MPAPGLRDVQASFWRSLHDGAADAALVQIVVPTPTLEPAARIDVYRTMYFWRLYEVLREDYPKTHEALGDDFEDLVRGYLTRHPSEHPSVRHLGGRLPDFLETDAVARERPWLADLARLERARVDVFDASDATPIRPSDLGRVAPEAWADLRFEPIPALAVVRSAFAVHDAWSAPADPVAKRPTTARVWRQDFVVFHAAMDEIEDGALSALRAGEPFATVCDVVAGHVGTDAAAAEAGALLARWIEDGLIARFVEG